MENRGILNWHGWSTMRKAQAIGALTGALITVGIEVLVQIVNTEGEQNMPTWILAILSSWVLRPTFELFSALGLSWQIYFPRPVSIWQLGAAVFINSLLLFLLATFFCWLVTKLRNIGNRSDL